MLSELDESPVSTNALAEKVQAKPASASGMLKQLADAGWVDHEAYRGVSLTNSGKSIAIDVIRRHRLWEVFLVERLGFRWDEVHELAEQLEHIESSELIDKLDAYLGHPSYDPHGDPIPTAEGHLEDGRKLAIADSLTPGQSAIVKGVVDSSDVFLRYLDNLKIRLGMQFHVIERHAFDGSATVDGQGIWTASVLKNIYVEIVKS